MKQRLLNQNGAISIFLALMVLVLTVSMAAYASTPVKEGPAVIKLQVNGLACPFCAYGLEKKLRALPGVADVSIDINNGRVVMEIKGSEIPDMEAVRKAVKKAGFTPGTVEYALVGRLNREDGTLRIADGKTVILLRFEKGKKPDKSLKDQAIYRVHGVLKRTSDGTHELVVSSIEAIEASRSSG